MGLTTFLKNFDGLSLTFSLAFLTAYGGHFLTKWRVGDIQEVQKRVLYGKAESLNGSELIDFMNAIIEENPKILMPAKKGNRRLFTTSMAFFIVAFCTTFYTGLSQIFLKTFTEGQIASINGVLYIVFFALLVLAVLLLMWEYRYWVDFGRFKTEYPSKVFKSIKVICEEAKSHIKQISSHDLLNKLNSIRQIKSVTDNIPPDLNEKELLEKLKTDPESRKNLANRLVRLFGLRNELIPYIDSRIVDLIDKHLLALFIIETGKYIFKEDKIEEFVTFITEIRSLVNTLEKKLRQEYEEHVK